MLSRHLQRYGIWVISGLIGGSTAAIAHATPERIVIAPSTPLAAAALTTGAVSLEPWPVSDLFVIDVPTGWLTEALAEEARAMITSYDATVQSPQATDIATEISLVSEPPETYVPQQLDTLIEAALAEEYVIDRYGITSVSGNDAFRLWLEQVPGEFSRQVITFVGDAEGRTAKIVSSYNDDAPATRDLIVQMHGSFRFDSAEE
ncbi:hypothetical protein [Leptolyngbya iicbica]|uniref:Uncharacterized protein n=2 Tax=Cyanophyceae TaxID=3028117 RepID=A0A4Q7E585_9CYAN|nr:hypothetical protein [Leptolyngbya sp. LK]RZM77398.1 hypothetical protein DYY88_17350 [Leptolyngbya sp. LK]